VTPAIPEDFLDERGRWHCTQCGACCRLAGIALGARLGPRLDRGDGVCRHLTDGNLCRIFATRPRECRTAHYPLPDREQARLCAQALNVVRRHGPAPLASPELRERFRQWKESHGRPEEAARSRPRRAR
jgi:Fe-S-cluster containining protein